MSDQSASTPADEAIAEFLQAMSCGQNLISAKTIRQLGGELCIRPQGFAAAAKRPLPPMEATEPMERWCAGDGKPAGAKAKPSIAAG